MASYQVEGRKRHQETSPVQPNRLGLFVDIEVRLPPRRPLSAEIREHRGPVNPIPLRQLIDTRASKIVSLQLADPTASSLLVVVSVIMTPPALTGDGATYTVRRTVPKARGGRKLGDEARVPFTPLAGTGERRGSRPGSPGPWGCRRSGCPVRRARSAGRSRRACPRCR